MDIPYAFVQQQISFENNLLEYGYAKSVADLLEHKTYKIISLKALIQWTEELIESRKTNLPECPNPECEILLWALGAPSVQC